MRRQRPAFAGLAVLLLAAPLTAGCATSGHGNRALSNSRVSGARRLRPSSRLSKPGRPAQGRSLIVGDLRAASNTVPCAPGTHSLGIRTGYSNGAPVSIRLCTLRGFRSIAPESTGGTRYYVPGSRGDIIVNSRVSGAVLALFSFAQKRGVTLRANSSYRSMRYQRALCAADRECRHGNYIYVARPGWSNHQLGVAIDFSYIYGTGGRSCTQTRAVDPASRTWRLLDQYAHRFGYRQYAAESWHWDPLKGPDRC